MARRRRRRSTTKKTTRKAKHLSVPKKRQVRAAIRQLKKLLK